MIIRHSLRLLLLMCVCSMYAQAGPPFFTDDPEPVPLRHYEFYLFSTVDRAYGGYAVAVPAFEFNVGAAPNLQLHIVAPAAMLVQEQEPTAYGAGDVELGAKYRFIQEQGARLQVGTFPMLELPTGDSDRGLGNGRLWSKLPLWVQKSWGPWTSYGGGGYIINHAPAMRDHPFFGWQAQREVNKRLTLGAEWFNPGRGSVVAGNTHLVNVGGTCNVNQSLSVLFTVGHSVQGDSHTVAYVGLYWTWGPKTRGPETKSGLTPAMSTGGNQGLRSRARTQRW